MSTSAASLAAEEGDTRLRARRGLAIYFAVLVPLSAVFQVIMQVVRFLAILPAALSVESHPLTLSGELCPFWMRISVMSLADGKDKLRDTF
jgi:hypothetical protein